MTLPEHFLNKMKELLADEYADYTAGFDKTPLYGIRVNTAKTDIERFQQISPVPLTGNVPWCREGFYYDGSERPAKHPYYYAGLYYLQEPSAMLPAAMLPIEEGNCVLDLCAAPGGKSTQLGAKLNGTGLLVANDISNSRAKALLKNLELSGMGNIAVTSETPKKLAEKYTGFFDRILVDAPCSGEGMFRREPSMINDWLEKGPEYYSEIQKEILSQAVAMLKPGGFLLYSTCTFSPLEDEGNVLKLLHQFPELEICIPEQTEGMSGGIACHPDLCSICEEFSAANTISNEEKCLYQQNICKKMSNNKKLIDKNENIIPYSALSACVRIFPQSQKGEGHFAVLLKKSIKQRQTAEEDRQDLQRRKKAVQRNEKILSDNPELAEFFNLLRFSPVHQGKLEIIEERVYLLPFKLEIQKGIRYLRTGLLLGERKKKRFEPSQALAMYLKKEEFANTVDFSVGDSRTVKYLKGETIDCEGAKITGADGWCLVCTDGLPLGFARKNKQMLKNKYYPGWRWL